MGTSNRLERTQHMLMLQKDDAAADNQSDQPPPPPPPLSSREMRTRDVLRIAAAHSALYAFVVLYVLAGGRLFHLLERDRELDRHSRQKEELHRIQRWTSAEIARLDRPEEVSLALTHYLQNISQLHLSVDAAITLSKEDGQLPLQWTLPASVLYAFTILTTIGYGNVFPTSQACRLATMAYGALGIPLFLITIADLGRFSKTGVMKLLSWISRREIKKQGEMKLLREIGEVVLVAIIFLVFIAIGSTILPLWEEEMDFYTSLYFSFTSLTTIGLGDVTPRRMDCLLPTLVYITIGLWLTTALVEQLADVFRLVHYAGRKVTDVRGFSFWLGGQKMQIGTLIQAVCKRVGVSEKMIDGINWDRTVDGVLSGRPIEGVAIFPWHFADFLDKDPPPIDDSITEEDGTFGLSAARTADVGDDDSSSLRRFVFSPALRHLNHSVLFRRPRRVRSADSASARFSNSQQAVPLLGRSDTETTNCLDSCSSQRPIIE